MDLDLWWLLVIPVAFAFGWVAARYDLKALLSESSNLPRSYFRGLNFLLNEQPDQAIDAFIEVVKLDPETIELHFALGNLFRRRGETDRAIRVHQNLLSRADLPVNERDHALYELGQDFLKAGLLDRAEETFKALQSGDYALGAQRSLLTIYQIEKDWNKSIDTARRLETMGAASLDKEIGHFHCELAQEALQQKKPDEARRQLELALKAYPQNVRATILFGDVDAAAGEYEKAIAQWLHVEEQNAAYLPLVAEKLMKAYEALGRQEDGADLLTSWVDRYPSNDLLDVAYQHVSALRGPEAAHALARTQMQKSPNLAGMTRLLEAQQAVAEEPRRSELELMRTLIRQRTKNLPRYTCQNCGFRARLFYWQCPGCSGWESYAPRRVEPITASS
ncbi:Lipopolysaccharide biosynthesis regulator YciM, contains six TPR domains and a predicted metal-binding C-terminal domain [Burkholderia sp. YR290]|jgi:lipopolysaccharide biosynthesis regulator YciM|uniref:lipopolysaccharide assembly protein LapB n=1 Tax=Paraburkholderia hospita TaxID=169430 RepID=UPI0009A63E82|nr:lipopolysaccharide assembly protein LapB [Paraburkholderia hospita]SKC77601.1 Lipopolysaccharide biosynthesis regulator YciM, contains six TPR domains and a predicted metal-binding C-terminal domain [Paraburkholderia hospita]SOE54967.1 Lipopolysaccharide biosynthesis regulator YciM, contains six TPR domains and a predicted metal-binding C-terminal domain [Burkholderia sp. YR290]